MATISKTHTFSAGAVIVAAEHNTNFDTIYNDYNGNITNDNCSSTMGLVDTKLDKINTANKVNLTALRIDSQTAGDIMYASSATVLTRLAAGASGQLLQSAGTAAPAWATAGRILQTVNTVLNTSAVGTNIIPFDNTSPTVTEGTQFLSLAVTPVATANSLKIDTTLFSTEQADAASNLVVALFQDVVSSGGPTTANAIATGVRNLDTQAQATCDGTSLTFIMSAATTTAITFTVRAGCNAGAIIVNGTGAGTALMGGTLASTLVIEEISA